MIIQRDAAVRGMCGMCVETFITEFCEVELCHISDNSIDYSQGNILARRPRRERDGVSVHEAERKPSKELAGHLVLVQTLASGQGRS